MSNSSRVSLDDTLHLLQLVRETALARSRQTSQSAGAQGEASAEKLTGLADKLEPVVDRMKELRGAVGKTEAAKPEAAAGILGQADFQQLLAARRGAAEQSAVQETESISGQITAEALRLRTAQAFLNAQTGQPAGGGQASSATAAQGADAGETAPSAQGVSLSSVLERNRMINAMASASMNEVDIARQFGLSREEVRLVLNRQEKSSI